MNPELTPEQQRVRTMRIARLIGCRGVHQGPNGEWMPCATHEELLKISNQAEKKRRPRRRDPVRQAMGTIDTLPDGGLVSGPPLGGTQGGPAQG